MVKRVTSADLVRRRELILHRRNVGVSTYDRFAGLNFGISKSGLTQLIGNQKEPLDPAFEQGAGHPDTIRRLNDPPASRWLLQFVSDRIDGLLLITGPDRASVLLRSKQLLTLLGRSIKVVHSEIGAARPGKQRGHEHFGFLDGISQPGIRGLTPASDPWHRPDRGLPGQDAIWPGEFVFGYPGQHPKHPTRQGPEPEMAAPWMRNGS